MSRMEGVPNHKAGLIGRIAFWLARRKVGRVPEPMRLKAHNGPILRAYGGFEMGLQKARSVDPKLKTLASLKAGALVGCVW